MRSEYLFPGVPKLFLKNSKIAKLAHDHPNEHVLECFFGGDFTLETHKKLEARNGDSVLIGLNDIVVHNANPRHAIRYEVSINGETLHHEIIGDGIVCATPLGSTGYHRSITDSMFETGIGLAFNNSTEQTDHIVLPDDAEISVRIIRGPAICYADNQDESFELSEGDVVTIKKSSRHATMVRVK